MIRIITGIYKGRRLKLVPSPSVRPMQDKVKGALFNILGDRVRGSVCLDGFAGTGSVGLEALSRGAATVRLRRRVLPLDQGHQAERRQVRGRGEGRRPPSGVQPGRHRPGQAGRPLRPHLPRPALPAPRGEEPAQGHPQARPAQARAASSSSATTSRSSRSSATSSSSAGWPWATTSSPLLAARRRSRGRRGVRRGRSPPLPPGRPSRACPPAPFA